MDRATTNGGFPLPPDSEPARLVTSRHAACGAETRVRLPRHVPARAVRRVVCESCESPYEATGVEDRGVDGAEGARSRRLPTFGGRAWRLASVPLAAGMVLLALTLLQGGDEPAATSAGKAERAAAGAGVAGRDQAPRERRAAGSAQLVSESTFSLALPGGWQRVPAEGGATFAAVAPGGEADATLWVEHDPKLDFAAFEARSLDQLEQLAGSARTVARTAGPTPEATSVRIAAAAPEGVPAYEALLRSSGERWYYLATTLQPDASADAREGLALIRDSLVPEGGS